MDEKWERRCRTCEDMDDLRYAHQEEFYKKLLGGFFLVSLFAGSLINGLFTLLGL